MAVIEAISTTYLEADVANLSSVVFSSIPSTYEHLQLRISGRDSTTDYWSPDLLVLFNSDSGSNYSSHYMYADGTSATTASYTGQSSMIWGQNSGSHSTSQPTQYGGIIVDILDYANTNKNTTVCIVSGVINTPQSALRFSSSLWDDTSVVSQIDLIGGHSGGSGGGWVRGSEITLYGLNSS